MMYAPPLATEIPKEAATSRSPTPSIMPVWFRSRNDNRCPLDIVLDRKGYDGSFEKGQQCSPMDTYHGPLSARANAIIRSMGFAPKGLDGGNTIGICYLPSYVREHVEKENNKSRREQAAQCSRYEQFVSQLQSEDKPRVKFYETNLRSSRNKNEWKEWLMLRVTIDGLTPPVERVLIVTPNITMNRLHRQVLCATSKYPLRY